MANAAPLVSVVTPTLNQGRFLSETIRSVVSQDYPSTEYVIVDGGSTDDTREILGRCGDGVRWISAPGEGQTAAINRGWRATRGPIVAWLNSDDTYLPGAVRQAVAFLQEHAEVDAVYGDCDYVDAEGRFLRPYPARPHEYRQLVREAISYIPQPATFLRRRGLDSVGYLDESLEYAMDLDLWLRLGGAGRVLRHLPVRLATLRLHGEAKSIRAVDGFAPELVRIFERLFAAPGLPDDIRALESEAMSSAHYRASQCLFWAGRFKEARRHALLGWRHSPLSPRPQLLFAGCGAPALKLLERWRGNPFRMGIEG